jgi:hypothetical protein
VDLVRLEARDFTVDSTACKIHQGIEDFDVVIQPANSSDTTNALARFTYNLDPMKKYILVANGIVSGSGYDPVKPFDIYVYDMAREESTMSGNTDVLVFHGSTDAPVVDVVETGVGAGTIVDNLDYSDFAGYLELPTANYILDIRDESGMTTVVRYQAPLADLNLNDYALAVIASGFLVPENNSNGDPFGLFVALPQGGALVELPLYTEPETTRVQVIHNSADAAAATVDVWLNDQLLIDNFAFRTASPFIDAPAGVDFDVVIQPANSSDTTNALARFTYNLDPMKKYILVANGIVSGSGYDPVKPFDIYVYDMAREKSTMSGNTDVLVFHGSTDAPVVDVFENIVVNGMIIDNMAYEDFRGYLELPTTNYQIEIRDETGTTTVATYNAPLEILGLNGYALTLIASGFLNPGNNSNGEAFGLYAVLPQGGEFIALPNTTGVDERIIDVISLMTYPNPSSSYIMIDFNIIESTNVTVELINLTGSVVYSENLGYKTEQVHSHRMDVDGLPQGIYIMTLWAGQTKVARKIQVTK